MTDEMGARFPMDAWDDGRNADLADRLTAAVDALGPSAAALTRMEAVVMAGFQAAPGTAAAGRRLRLPALQVPMILPGRWSRRIAAFGLAGSLVFGSVALALGVSGPGQPLYRLRLQVETMSLPAPGSAARFDADARRTGTRLDELTAADRTGDAASAADAAGAYEAEVNDALAANADAFGQARLAALLAQQAQYLARLAETAAPPVRPSIESAARAARNATDAIAAPKPSGGGARSSSVRPPIVTTPAGPADPDGPDSGRAKDRGPRAASTGSNATTTADRIGHSKKPRGAKPSTSTDAMKVARPPRPKRVPTAVPKPAPATTRAAAPPTVSTEANQKVPKDPKPRDPKQKPNDAKPSQDG
jgi:hypothetical protein